MTQAIKVVVTDYIEANLDWEKAELEKRGGIVFETHQLKFKPESEVLKVVQDADIIVVNMVKITPSLIAGLKKCRLIIRHGIGYDNVDVEACTKAGIQFAYQPHYCKEDVAEHAIALIFACARRLVRSRKTLKDASASGQWDFTGLFPLYRMEGKTLGILGVGRIGSRVYKKLRSFGFRILGCDTLISDATKAELSAMGEITWVDHDTIFRQSDFLTVHTPLSPSTRHIVNAKTLAMMKPTAYVINTSRGGMVDADALAAALRKGTIAGAAIDVFEVEPPPPDMELFKLDNCILTPHIGWASVESGQAIREDILNDIIAGAEGRDARSVVNSIRR